jgi:hypothetical protein
MNHYTPEYKDAVRMVAKLYNNGILSYSTFDDVLTDMEHKLGVDQKVIAADIATLYDAWAEYEVLS